jgi:hypothetical protein
MCLLQQRDDFNTETSCGEKIPSHYFNSFFMTRLMSNKEQRYDYEKVKRWTKRINIFILDKIFIPVNISNMHWTMIIVYMQFKEIHYYDSMNGRGVNEFLIHILQWLKDESNEKYDNRYKIDDNEWQLIDRESNVPQQHNGSDCGMFTILCADFVSDNIPFGNSYDQSEILSYRKKVCAAILRGELNF